MASLLEKLEAIETKYKELESLIADPSVIADIDRWQHYNKEHAALLPIVGKIRERVGQRCYGCRCAGCYCRGCYRLRCGRWCGLRWLRLWLRPIGEYIWGWPKKKYRRARLLPEWPRR